MKIELITCTMCGHRFDPQEHAACQACPLQTNCQLVCCPECGFEMIDTNKSALVRLITRWLPGLNQTMDTRDLHRSQEQ